MDQGIATILAAVIGGIVMLYIHLSSKESKSLKVFGEGLKLGCMVPVVTFVTLYILTAIFGGIGIDRSVVAGMVVLALLFGVIAFFVGMFLEYRNTIA